MNGKPNHPESVPPPPPSNHRVASDEQITRYITTIKNAPQQIGEHIVRALQHPNTVAVLTTVVIGPGGDRHVISAALNPTQMVQIDAILQQAELECEPETPCVGFHCLVRPKQNKQAPTESPGEPGEPGEPPAGSPEP